jgi:hypothetical protein
MVDLVNQVTELKAQVARDNEKVSLALMKMQGEIDRLKRDSWNSRTAMVSGVWIVLLFACILGAVDGRKARK